MNIKSLPKINTGSPWFMLAAALIMGAASIVLAKRYLDFKEREISRKLTAEQPKMGEVVVPTRDLPKGARLTSADLASRNVPEFIISEQMLTPDNYTPMLGRELEYSAEHGKPIVRSQIRFGGKGDFADMIHEKRRAITIRVDEINSISGMLRPGDLVDIFVSLRDKEGVETVSPLLMGVSVRAVGQMLEGDSSLAGQQNGDDKISYTSATLEVTPEDAQRLILAQDSGRITATLRNPDDVEPYPLREMNSAQFLSRRMTPSQATDGAGASAAFQTPEVAREPQPEGGQIRYIIGGGGKVKISNMDAGMAPDAPGAAGAFNKGISGLPESPVPSEPNRDVSPGRGNIVKR